MRASVASGNPGGRAMRVKAWQNGYGGGDLPSDIDEGTENDECALRYTKQNLSVGS
jgi:hypothetical protein